MRQILLTFVIFHALAAIALAAERDGKSLFFRVLDNVPVEADVSDVCCDAQYNFNQSMPVQSYRTSYGSDPIWVKVEDVGNAGLLQFSPILDEVTLFVRSSKNDEWYSATTGDMIASDRKTFETPFMALPLPESFDRDQVFARINMPMAVSVRVVQWDLPNFITMQRIDATTKTFLLGFVSSIVLYNIVVSFLARDPVFLVNALCITSLLVLALYLSGYGAAYFWKQWPTISNNILYFSILLAVMLGGLFIYLFLKTDNRPRREIQSILYIPALALFCSIVLPLLGTPAWAQQAAALICAGLLSVYLVYFIVRRVIRGDDRARLLAVPFLIAVAPGVGLIALDKIGGYPLFNLGNNAMEITLAVEAILFSLALASRIRFSERETAQAVDALIKEQARNSSMALDAQDEERKRLSKELHDGVGHELLLVVNDLKRTARHAKTPEMGQTLDGIARSASQVMSDLRQVSHDMHPATLEYLELPEALEDISQRMNQQSKVEFVQNVNLNGLKLSPHAKLQLVRIIQECYSNVLKHSGASICRTNIEADSQRLTVCIEDNGQGIDGEKQTGNGDFGLGWISMRERAQNLGGKFRHTNGDLGGLAILIDVPLCSISKGLNENAQ